MTYADEARAVGQRADQALANAAVALANADAAIEVEHDARVAAEEALAALHAEFDAYKAAHPPVVAPTGPTGPSVPVSSMRFGVSQARRVELEGALGVRFAAVRAYEKSVPANQAATIAASLSPGVLPVVSAKVADWAGAAKAGSSFAKSLETYLRSITRETVVVLAHEPENDGNPPADFKAMLARALDTAAAVANPHVTMAINLMTSWISTKKGPVSEEYILGGRQDYLLTWDGYTHAKGDKAATKFGPALALNTKYSLGFGICETANEVDAAGWVKEVSAWCATHGAVFCCYWPSQVSASDPQYYPPPSAFPAFKEVALAYGGKAT